MVMLIVMVLYESYDHDTYVCFSLELPYNDYFEYFGPDFKLHISPSNMPNSNQQDYLDRTKYVSYITYACYNNNLLAIIIIMMI